MHKVNDFFWKLKSFLASSIYFIFAKGQFNPA